MATQLFLLDTVPDTHLGTDNVGAKGAGTAKGWTPRALSTSRGSGVVASDNLATVTGPTTGVDLTTGSVALEWISPPVAADVTISGTITCNIWASESNMSANATIVVMVQIIRANATGTRNSNTLQNIVVSLYSTELAVTTRAVNNFTMPAYGAQTLNRGDRLRITLLGDDSGTMASGFTFNASWNGTSAAADGDTYVTLTENVTFESAPTTVLSQTSAGQIESFGTSSNERSAQSFVAGTTGLVEVRAWLRKNSSPTDNVVLEIQSDSAGVPSGSVVGTVATVAAASLTTTLTEYTYACSIALTQGATYHLVYGRSGSLDISNNFSSGYSTFTVGGWSGKTRYTAGSWSSTTTPITVRLEFLDTRTTVYLTDTASAVSTASIDKEAWTSRGSGVTSIVTNTSTGWTAPVQATATAGGTVVDWFTRPLTAFTLTGLAVANIRALESNAAANATLRCEIARVEGDGTSPTVWCSWCCAPTGTDNGELTTSEVARTINLSGDDLAITNGQRLRIRLYNEDISSAAMVTGHTVTRYYAGTSGGASGDTYIAFPQTLTEYSVSSAPGPSQSHRQRRASRFLTSR